MKSIPSVDSPPKLLSDVLLAVVASTGENMCISRGIGFTLSPNRDTEASRLMAYCHSSNASLKQGVREVRFGKYVAIVRYRHIGNQVSASFFIIAF